MSPKQGIKRLKALLGPRAAVSENRGAATAAERQAAEAQLAALGEAEAALKAARQARRAELLRDPEYQQLVGEHERAKQALAAARGTARSYRLAACIHGAWFFEVVAEADNYEALVAAVEAKCREKSPC